MDISKIINEIHKSLFRQEILIFLTVCIIFFVIVFFGNIWWEEDPLDKYYEGFENENTPTDQDFKDCATHGYNSATIENKKVYCTLKGLDNIKNASTQKCVLDIRGEAVIANDEYYCDNKNRENTRKNRNAIRKLYDDNKDDPDLFGTCRQSVDYSLSTPVMKFCKLAKRKSCYKPPVEGVGNDVIQRYLQKAGDGNLRPCPDCPPGMKDAGTLKGNESVVVCYRINNKGRTLGDINIKGKDIQLVLGRRRDKIHAAALYVENSLEPAIVSGYEIVDNTIRPWGTNDEYTITSIYNQANELYNFNDRFSELISRLLPFRVTIGDSSKQHTVFLRPDNLRFINIRGHVNVTDDEQDAYVSQYNTERKIAGTLNRHMNIRKLLKDYMYGLMKDGEFREMIRERGRMKYSFTVKEKVLRGFSLFRRRSKRYKTVTRRYYRYVFIKNYVGDDDEDTKKMQEYGINKFIGILERMLNNSHRRLNTRKMYNIYNAEDTHNAGLAKIKEECLEQLLRHTNYYRNLYMNNRMYYSYRKYRSYNF